MTKESAVHHPLSRRARTRGSNASDGDVALAVENLSIEVVTEDGWKSVVDDVSFELRKGEVLGLVGESGSGKSLTCLAIAGLLPPRTTRITSKSIRLFGEEISTYSNRQLAPIRGRELSMIFQDPMSSLNPAFTIGDQIAETYRRHFRTSRSEARARAIELLDRVGVPDPAQRLGQYPHEFSGGMRQRVMIAIALAARPRVLIADEPTTALDVTVQAQVLDMLKTLQRDEDLSVIFITHDLGVVADICTRVNVMYAGQLIESGSIDRIYEEPQHPYMEALLRSMPRLDQRIPAHATLPGSPPRIGEMPTGCRFHPRCPYATDACSTETPLLRPAPREGLVRCLYAETLTLEGTR